MEINKTELKLLIKECLFEILAGDSSPPQDWVSLQEAWRPLGYPSYDALYKAVSDGLFREGKELRDRRRTGAQKARWQINLAAAQRRLLEDPSNRRAV